MQVPSELKERIFTSCLLAPAAGRALLPCNAPASGFFEGSRELSPSCVLFKRSLGTEAPGMSLPLPLSADFDSAGGSP